MDAAMSLGYLCRFRYHALKHFLHEEATLAALDRFANVLINIAYTASAVTDSIRYLSIGDFTANTHKHGFIPD
jgi:hypothetical protein